MGRAVQADCGQLVLSGEAQGLGWSSGLETALKEKRRLCAPWHRGWVERQDGVGVSLHVSPAQ